LNVLDGFIMKSFLVNTFIFAMRCPYCVKNECPPHGNCCWTCVQAVPTSLRTSLSENTQLREYVFFFGSSDTYRDQYLIPPQGTMGISGTGRIGRQYTNVAARFQINFQPLYPAVKRSGQLRLTLWELDNSDGSYDGNWFRPALPYIDNVHLAHFELGFLQLSDSRRVLWTEVITIPAYETDGPGTFVQEPFDWPHAFCGFLELGGIVTTVKSPSSGNPPASHSMLFTITQDSAVPTSTSGMVGYQCFIDLLFFDN